MNSRSLLRELFDTFLLAVLLALFVRTFLVQVFSIPSSSMEEGLLVGDQVVVNKLIYAHLSQGGGFPWLPTRDIRRGDVVVFRAGRRDFIKRCVGLPGETLEIVESRLVIDGRPLEEPYLHFTDLGRDDSFGPYRVPEDSYFCLGDHRDRSRDSRTLGPVPARLVHARAWLVYWSFAPQTAQDQGEWSMLSRWGRYPRWVR